jgi:hypothetical protein
MYKIMLFCLIFCLFNGLAIADLDENTGMLFGDNYAFYFTAPQGWELDKQSGVGQGLHMVFYPQGETFADSPVIAYARSVSKGPGLQSVKDKVVRTVNEFHSQGSPNYKAEMKDSVSLPHGKQIAIYYFEGDQWGNYEAAGYIEEEETINFLVFNARSKKDFDRHTDAFKKILLSYKNVYAKDNVDEKKFSEMVNLADKTAGTPEGEKYEDEIIKSLEQKIAKIMQDCTSYTQKKETIEFDAVFKIDPDGKIVEAYIRPVNALTNCFKGSMATLRHPAHQFGTFLHHINMKITK